MPKRINRIRGILRPMLAIRPQNSTVHEIPSATSKRIIFCRTKRSAAHAERAPTPSGGGFLGAKLAEVA